MNIQIDRHTPTMAQYSRLNLAALEFKRSYCAVAILLILQDGQAVKRGFAREIFIMMFMSFFGVMAQR